jgi:hypothetical protein
VNRRSGGLHGRPGPSDLGRGQPDTDQLWEKGVLNKNSRRSESRSSSEPHLQGTGVNRSSTPGDSHCRESKV